MVVEAVTRTAPDRFVFDVDLGEERDGARLLYLYPHPVAAPGQEAGEVAVAARLDGESGQVEGFELTYAPSGPVLELELGSPIVRVRRPWTVEPPTMTGSGPPARPCRAAAPQGCARCRPPAGALPGAGSGSAARRRRCCSRCRRSEPARSCRGSGYGHAAPGSLARRRRSRYLGNGEGSPARAGRACGLVQVLRTASHGNSASGWPTAWRGTPGRDGPCTIPRMAGGWPRCTSRP